MYTGVYLKKRNCIKETKRVHDPDVRVDNKRVVATITRTKIIIKARIKGTAEIITARRFFFQFLNDDGTRASLRFTKEILRLKRNIRKTLVFINIFYRQCTDM